MDMAMKSYYIGLGSNLGETKEHLLKAVALMNERVGCVSALSSFYETEPWGFTSTHQFTNAVCLLQSELEPLDLLNALQRIERDMGRTRKSVEGRYEDRIIDLDILIALDEMGHESVFSDARLTLPHPLMQQRDFVMIPLNELRNR